MRFIALLGVAVLIGGCIHDGDTFDVSEGKSRLVEAEHRAILSVKRTVLGSDGLPVRDDRDNRVNSVAVCAEPSPDALLSTALELGGKVSKEAVGALLEATFLRSERVEYVGLRTQTIQLLRDAYFRLCEAFLNDGIDAIAYDVLQRRFQSQIVALLAVEQLTGAVTAGRRGANGNPSTKLARIAGALEESENVLRDLRQRQKEAKAALDAHEAQDDAAKAAIEAARQELATIRKQIERRQHVIRVLKESFVKAAQGTESRDAGAPAKATTDASGRSPASDVADAVRAITLNAINQDYESQVCFETLRYHNHLVQFRNDTNNAFDSGGIATVLKGNAFLNHCGNLFASQADFRSARVGAVEAFVDAIERVTKKVGTGNLSTADAAIYIRALAEAVPTEPGIAFLSRETKVGSILRSADGSKQKTDAKYKTNTVVGAGTVGSSGN